MKKCPFCAEEIQDAAIKCKHCGEFLEPSASTFGSQSEQKVQKWYFKKGFIILTLACVGPLGLPLIWFHPDLSRLWKVGWTVAILLVTALTVVATMESIKVLMDSYGELEQMLKM